MTTVRSETSESLGAGSRLAGAAPGALAFLVTGGVVTACAADGGAYDVVVRQQGTLVLWWLVAGLALLGLLPRTRPPRSALVAMLLLTALGAWTAMSMSWTSSSERTLLEVARISTHLGVFAVAALALGSETWRPALAGATTAAVVICAYALGTRLHPGFLGSDNTVAGFVGTQRLSLPLNYWNAVGAWAGMTSALCLGWSAHARAPIARALAVAAVPISIVVSYLTFSRASLGGTAIGLLVLLAVSRNRWTLLVNAALSAAVGAVAVLVVRAQPEIERGTGGAGGGKILLVLVAGGVVAGALAALAQRVRLDEVRMSLPNARRALAVGAVVGVVVAVALAVTKGQDAYDSFTKTRPTPIAAGADPAARLTNLNGTRHLVWESAVDSFGDHPWGGSGAGTFEFTWNRDARDAESVKDAHSLYLEGFSELGLPGGLLTVGFVVALLWMLVVALRRNADRGAIAAAAGAAAAYLFGAGLDWLWESTAVTVLALVVLGCVAASTGRPTTRAAAFPLRLLAAVAAVAVCMLQLPGLVSTSEERRSATDAARGAIPEAVEHATNAIDAEPWAASPFVQRALVREQTGQLDLARTDLQLAQQRESLNWRIPLILARVEAKRGDANAALAAYRRAKALRPLGQFFRTG